MYQHPHPWGQLFVKRLQRNESHVQGQLSDSLCLGCCASTSTQPRRQMAANTLQGSMEQQPGAEELAGMWVAATRPQTSSVAAACQGGASQHSTTRWGLEGLEGRWASRVLGAMPGSQPDFCKWQHSTEWGLESLGRQASLCVARPHAMNLKVYWLPAYCLSAIMN